MGFIDYLIIAVGCGIGITVFYHMILIRRGISATRVFIPWKKEKHIIPQMQV